MSGALVSVEMKDGAVRGLLNRVNGFLKEGAAEQIIEQAAKEMTVRHLIALNAARHRGYTSKGFYANAAASVQSTSRPGTVLISIPYQGIAQRYFGGDISAKLAKALAIPMAPEAYAVDSPRQFGVGELKLVWPKGQNFGWLMKAGPRLTKSSKGGKRVTVKSSGDSIIYLLVRRVHQDPDETVLPTDSAYTGAAMLALKQKLQELS
jgi:hypothetical protein